MNITPHIRYWLLTQVNRPRRYRALFRTICQQACRRIVEIGIYNGVHAVQMIQTAAMHHRPQSIDYYGFDLFEELTEDLLKSEFSKKPSTYDAMKRKLEKTGANIYLYKGNSKITLPNAVDAIGEVDFVFIDGGHSMETIQSDWAWVQKLMGDDTLVIFDDYYLNAESEIAGLGCQTLINQLDWQQYEVNVLEPADIFRKKWGKLKIQMAMVKKTASPGNND